MQITLQYLERLTFLILASKCFCEHKIGAPDLKQNGITCEKNGKPHSYNYCADNEWCIGATDSSSTTYEVDSLCVKGSACKRF